jgi:hypothetical protein
MFLALLMAASYVIMKQAVSSVTTLAIPLSVLSTHQ